MRLPALHRKPQIVRAQGLEFFNIPIVFSQPTADDFEAFARTMRSFEGKRVLVHCQIRSDAARELSRSRLDRLVG